MRSDWIEKEKKKMRDLPVETRDVGVMMATKCKVVCGCCKSILSTFI
jgi:hypothetical protein